jgi:hypothetical protein
VAVGRGRDVDTGGCVAKNDGVNVGGIAKVFVGRIIGVDVGSANGVLVAGIMTGGGLVQVAAGGTGVADAKT